MVIHFSFADILSQYDKKLETSDYPTLEKQ